MFVHREGYPIQRCFDLLAAGAGLLLLSPLLIVIAGAVKVFDGGPVFYRSQRVGWGGKLFSIYKFRSMVQGADKIGGGLTMQQDRRVTRVGRVLRNYKLDELPQLMNVVKGDMGLVGARPEDPRYVAHYSPEQQRILAYRPGITSPASLRFRNEEHLLKGEDAERLYLEQILPQKLAMDLEYFSRRTLWSDLMVIVHTIGGTSR